MHPFFSEIQKYPDLLNCCNTEITNLPMAFKGSNNIKAILIGADPTNNGIRNEHGQINLQTVFGIDSKYENYFFSAQLKNINAIELEKEDLYVQNICRNYFIDQTSKNKKWNEFAKLWIKYLKEELSHIDSKVPLLITAEKIMNVLVPIVTKPRLLYEMKVDLPISSDSIERNVLPLYRHPRYSFSDKNAYSIKWINYQNYLINYFK